MNQKGYSWPEAILTLAVIIIIFGTLLPLATKMTTILHNKKLAMYAAEALYHGSILYKSYGTQGGVRQIEGDSYEWVVHTHSKSVCVHYSLNGEVLKKCADY